MHRVRAVAAGIGVAALMAALTIVTTQAYSTSAYRWASSPVPFYVNPANADVSTSAATTAIQAAMNVWNTQAGTPFRFSYAGQVIDTATANDRRNVAIFRGVSNGSTIATTYSWWSGGVRVDTDIVFWDGGWAFFTGSSGCSSGAYIEDIAAHEFGHSMGLGHSSVSGATMYPSYTRCSQAFRTLSADDIAGARALYGTEAPAPANTAPIVSIAAPLDGVSVPMGTLTTFSGSATDAEDGNLTGNLTWTSSMDGLIGNGSGFLKALSAGTHTITAKALDTKGLAGIKQVSMVVTMPAPSPDPAPAPPAEPTAVATLLVKAWKEKGLQKAGLTWSGLVTSAVDVYRNGTKIATTANDGSLTDHINNKGGGSYSYKVCEAGSSTNCSNQAVASF